MGRSPCCAKEGLNRGAWTAMEDKALTDYIVIHGEGHWRILSKRAGLKRCEKSCRMRWLNYLRPDIKRGNISDDEEELIIKLHKLLGNRIYNPSEGCKWSLIAGRLPGRTDNEIKNYWTTHLIKKYDFRQSNRKDHQKNKITKPLIPVQAIRSKNAISSVAIRTKAVKCTGRVFIRPPFPSPPLAPEEPSLNNRKIEVPPTRTVDPYSKTDNSVMQEGLLEDPRLDFPNISFDMMDDLSLSEFLEPQQMLDFYCDFSQATVNEGDQLFPSSPALEEPILFSEEMMDDRQRSGYGLDVAAGVEMGLGDYVTYDDM